MITVVTLFVIRLSMLSSNNVSKTILYIAEQPDSQIIEDLTLMPTGGAF